MQIPQFIYLSSFQIYTSLLFVLAGVLLSLFVLWYEGTKDGFDYEKLFDLLFINLILSLILSFAAYWFFVKRIYLTGTDYYHIASYSTFLITYFTIGYFAKLWSWSFFRLADLCALVFSILLVSLLLSQGMFLLFGLGVLFITAIIFLRRNLQSGLIFSLFLFIYSIVSLLSFRGLDNLIFYLVLITIGISTFLKRKKVGNGYAQFSIRSKFYRRPKRTFN